MPNKQILQVEENGADARLDAYLAETSGLSRSAVQKLIKEGKVLLHNAPADKKVKLRPGDQIVFVLPEETSAQPQPEEISLDILYEDEDLLVVNKPKGMVVHPGAGNPTGTLVNALLFHCGSALSDLNGMDRPGIVHRIDKNTSGLLVAAKNNRAHASLAEQIQAHTVTRVYHAVVHGVVKEDMGTLDFPLGRHPIDRKKRCVGGENPRQAVTHFQVLERYPKFTYLTCRLETGRTHQIRVHCAHIGHPVAGDDVYGPKKGVSGLNGQCLHAKTLGFIHPTKQEYMEFDSELPAYFQAFLRKVKQMR